jgi:hypothetical protein
MPPTMVSVFEQYAQGRQAFEELRRQGFSLCELGLVESDGDLVDQVSTLATADVAGRGLSDVLVGMGVPRAPANQYARHLDARRTIVTVAVPAGARARTAARVLRRCGARDLSRF